MDYGFLIIDYGFLMMDCGFLIIERRLFIIDNGFVKWITDPIIDLESLPKYVRDIEKM